MFMPNSLFLGGCDMKYQPLSKTLQQVSKNIHLKSNHTTEDLGKHHNIIYFILLPQNKVRWSILTTVFLVFILRLSATEMPCTPPDNLHQCFTICRTIKTFLRPTSDFHECTKPIYFSCIYHVFQRRKGVVFGEESILFPLYETLSNN